MPPVLDVRPIIVALAGPNGAGKTTFYNAHLRDAGLRFINADDIAAQLNIGAYEAAAVANAVRLELFRQRVSFVFETVFSDPVGDKLKFLKNAADSGYAVVLCYVGIADAATSEDRVAMRVSQGGHDVPSEKLEGRFARTLANLKVAIHQLPLVLIYDNSDLGVPFRKVAEYQQGIAHFLTKPLPDWLAKLK
ncbi:MAG: zeta toxin family protein [Chthoniobacterales bacterium]